MSPAGNWLHLEIRSGVRRRCSVKKVILSADGDSIIYLVPDIVADNLEKYCIEFCDDWLWHSPQAAKYRMGAGVCYSEADFIDYLNKYKFPNEKSAVVKNLGWTGLGEELSEEFRELPCFNF